MRKFARSPITVLRSAGAEVQSLITRVTLLQEIESALRSVVPTAGAGHIGVASYEDGQLVLIVDSGTWATRLRYQQDNLRRALAQSLRLDLHELDIRVRPPAASVAPPPTVPRDIPASARRQLADSARYIEHPGLASALSRLARCSSARG